MKSMFCAGNALALLLAWAPPPMAAAQSTAPPPAGRIVSEQYRLNLGGEVGTFTDWERTDLSGFSGLSTTVYVDVVYGKKSDKWNSVGRINLLGAERDGKRRILSFYFYVDRATKQVTAKHQMDDGQLNFIDLPFALKQAIPFSIEKKSPGMLEVTTGDAIYEVECDFEVAAVQAIGSGVDVRFEPFVLKRAD